MTSSSLNISPDSHYRLHPHPHKHDNINNLLPNQDTRDDQILFDKQQQQSNQPIKNTNKIIYNIPQYKFQPFDLKSLQSNLPHLKKNCIYIELLSKLKNQNQKIVNHSENSLTNYKTYQFFYQTLKICNNKTQSQLNFYLRNLMQLYHNNKNIKYLKKNPCKFKTNCKYRLDLQDQIVRDTFKSNLPLQISQYHRKIYTLPTQQNQQPNDMDSYIKKNGQQVKTLIDSLAPSLLPSTPPPPSNPSKSSQLPNLYTTAALRMRTQLQQQQRKTLFEKLKKNQSRIRTQTSNNFYKPLKNFTNTFFHKTTTDSIHYDSDDPYKQALKQQPTKISEFTKTSSLLQNIKNPSNQTSLNFYKNNSSNLNKTTGFKTTLHNFVKKPYQQPSPSYNLNFNIHHDEEIQLFDLVDIQGVNLLKNPYEENCKYGKNKKKL